MFKLLPFIAALATAGNVATAHPAVNTVVNHPAAVVGAASLKQTYGSLDLVHAKLQSVNLDHNQVMVQADPNSQYPNQLFTVNFADNMSLFRRYFGQAATDQLYVGDYVNVRGGTLDASTGTITDADFTRDTSVMEYHGTFSGSVVSIDNGGFGLTLNSNERGQIKVSIDSNVKITDKNGNSLGIGQVFPGDNVTLHGMYDSSLGTVTFTNWLIDHSQPQQGQ